jgi:hypothetical protein
MMDAIPMTDWSKKERTKVIPPFDPMNSLFTLFR